MLAGYDYLMNGVLVKFLGTIRKASVVHAYK